MYETHNIHLAYINVLFFLIFFRNYIVLLFAFLASLTFTFFISIFLHFGTLLSIWETKCEVLQLAKLGKPRLPWTFPL